ncbi:MAG: hypothetical protein U9Q30_05315 [Campylobacterota bacterium]|nr:hypothetical protein [Campylobacterota bacterium]
MILNPYILTIFILNGMFLFLGSISFFLSIKIYLGWDIDSTTKKQYKLEKQSYLASVIIKYIFIIKLFLFLFFIFVLDKLSIVIPGAMCAAGVVNATDYGNSLFILKLLNIYIFGFWLILYNLNIKNELLPYTKIKYGLFIIAFILLLIEIILETTMFLSIDPTKLVDCCGVLYSASSVSYISYLFTTSPILLVSLFYINLFFIIIVYFYKQKEIYSLLSTLFLIISIITLIVFFGTYIYELPTHHCPFCFLQKDYNYIGYLIYITLYLGTFYGISVAFFKNKNYLNISLFFIIVYTIIVSYYPISYYLNNGVWL